MVASANLSANALGEAGLHEIGLFVPAPHEIDIDGIIRKLAPRKAKLSELRKLQRKHDLFWSAPAARKGQKAHVPTYKGRANGPRPTWWKVGWWKTYGDEEQSTTEFARVTLGVRGIEDFIDCNGAG
jgi:hypothetical protein